MLNTLSYDIAEQKEKHGEEFGLSSQKEKKRKSLKYKSRCTTCKSMEHKITKACNHGEERIGEEEERVTTIHKERNMYISSFP